MKAKQKTAAAIAKTKTGRFPVRCTAKYGFYGAGKKARRYRENEEFIAEFEVNDKGEPFVSRDAKGDPIVLRDDDGNWLLPYNWMERTDDEAQAPRKRRVEIVADDEPSTMAEMTAGAASRAAPVG